MRNRNSEIIKAASHIGHFLLPKSSLRDQAYWNQHWGALRCLPAFRAVLAERRHFFDKTRHRNDAWALITIIDTCWQTVRTLAGKSGSDQKWIERLLPADHRKLFPIGSSLSYVPIESALDDIAWAYGLNSSLRHPAQNSEVVDWMLNDPWQPSESERLLNAAEAIRSVLGVFDVHFGVENGFNDDIQEKRSLAATAARIGQAQAGKSSP